MRVHNPETNHTTRRFARRSSDVFLCDASEAVAVSKHRCTAHWVVGYGIYCALALLAAAVMTLIT